MDSTLPDEVRVVAAPQTVYTVGFSDERRYHLGFVVRHVERYIEHDADHEVVSEQARSEG